MWPGAFERARGWASRGAAELLGMRAGEGPWTLRGLSLQVLARQGSPRSPELSSPVWEIFRTLGLRLHLLPAGFCSYFLGAVCVGGDGAGLL